jgi:flagellar hook-basal body complex protein FliE
MDPLSFSRINPPQLIPSPGAAAPTTAAPDAPGSFAQLLGEAVARVQQVQGQADQEMQKLLNGEPVELHRVMLASEQAGLASEMLMATRNKVIDAYQEIMRMQI